MAPLFGDGLAAATSFEGAGFAASDDDDVPLFSTALPELSLLPDARLPARLLSFLPDGTCEGEMTPE